MRVIGNKMTAHPNQFCMATDRWLNNTIKGNTATVTFAVNTTLPTVSPIIEYFCDTFTVNAGVTVVVPAGCILVVWAKTITVNGSITASGASDAGNGNVINVFSPRDLAGAADVLTNAASYYGPFSAATAGGARGGQPSNATTKALLSLYSLQARHDYVSFRPQGTAMGGTAIFLIGETVNLGAAASLLCNGLAASAANASGGSAGVIGVFGNVLNFSAGSTISAAGGDSIVAGGGATNWGGGGGVAWAVGRASVTDNSTKSVAGGAAANGGINNYNGEAGSIFSGLYDWLA